MSPESLSKPRDVAWILPGVPDTSCAPSGRLSAPLTTENLLGCWRRIESPFMTKLVGVCGFTIATLCLLACGRTPLDNSPRPPGAPSLEDGGLVQMGRSDVEDGGLVQMGRSDVNVADAISPDACDPVIGCQARAFAIDNLGNLLDLRLPSGTTQLIGSSGGSLTDIALAPNGRLYGVDFGAASEIDATTGRATTLSTFTATNINAMDAAPDGTIYLAGGQNLYTLDFASGALVLVMNFSQGSSSGDLAFVNGRLLLTITGYGLHDYLLELDPVAHTSQIVGDTGYDCIYGLAAYGPKLYGMTCAGQVLSLDTDTGKGTALQQTNIVFWGASAR